MELSDVLPQAVTRLLATAGGRLPDDVPFGCALRASAASAVESGGDELPDTVVIACPRHILRTRAPLVRNSAALFDRLDPAKASVIKYQDFVERLQALPREDLLQFGLSSDDDIVGFASALWDAKYGSPPADGGELERELYGRAPSHALFHEHCLDHAAFSGPQGKGTVTSDTRAHLTISRGDFLRLLGGIGPNARPLESEGVRPPRALLPGAASAKVDAQQHAVRRPEEVLIDIDKTVRVGLRVKTTEWFRRRRVLHCVTGVRALRVYAEDCPALACRCA